MTLVHTEVLVDTDALADAAAALVAARILASGDRFTFAVSGGRTPWAMFARLAGFDLPWEKVEVFQVDERVAPDGSQERNLTQLSAALPSAAVRLHAMPVGDADLDAAAALYAADLPDRFDLVHLGLGPDGHTASLVPGDPVLDVVDREVALAGPYQGTRRMTLTYPVLDRAAEVLWLVAGADKVAALRQLRAQDRSIPAGRVRTAHQVLLCDAAADGAPV